MNASMEDKDNVGRNAEEKYKDIIDLPHHTSPTRPRMSREARAAQFGSFDALAGYGAAVAEAARITETERELTDDEKVLIDEILGSITQREGERVTVIVSYFRPDDRKAGGAYVTVEGEVKELDVYERCLVLTDGTHIPIDRMRSLTLRV